LGRPPYLIRRKGLGAKQKMHFGKDSNPRPAGYSQELAFEVVRGPKFLNLQHHTVQYYHYF
jgi:hypothetical protein